MTNLNQVEAARFMKLKFMSVLAGAITALSFASVLIVAGTPLAAKAQPTQTSPASPGQVQNQSPMAGVQLTQQQKDQLDQIRSNTSAQIQKILTPEQQNRYKVALQAGQGRQTAVAAMKLTDAQKTQLRQVVESARSQASAVFTSQQRQQIQQNLQQMQQHQ